MGLERGWRQVDFPLGKAPSTCIVVLAKPSRRAQARYKGKGRREGGDWVRLAKFAGRSQHGRLLR